MTMTEEQIASLRDGFINADWLDAYREELPEEIRLWIAEASPWP